MRWKITKAWNGGLNRERIKGKFIFGPEDQLVLYIDSMAVDALYSSPMLHEYFRSTKLVFTAVFAKHSV